MHRLLLQTIVRAQTDSGIHPSPQRYRRAISRPVTNLGAIASGEPRVTELLALLDRVSDRQRRLYILQEIARVYREDLDDAEAAAVALRAALQEGGDQPAVIAAVEQFADETDCWAELLAELMEDAAELGRDQPRRAADLWVRIARWFDSPVGYHGYANEAVREALELVPHHGEALATLAALLRAGEHWLDLIGVLERQAAVTDDDGERIEILLAVADVADSYLGDQVTAISACRSALDIDSGCRAAFETLRTLLLRADAAEEVVELLARRLDLIDDPDEALELAVEMARICAAQLGDRARAERAWEAIKDHRAAIARLRALLDSELGSAESATLHYRISWFWLRGEANEERAEWHLAQALAEDPGHTASMRMLGAIYQLRGDFCKAAMMLGRAAQRADDPRQRVELVVDSARIIADELDDPAGAAAVCEAAAAAGPPSVAITRMLATLYARLGRWVELQPLVEGLESEVVGGRGDRAEILHLYHLIARSAAERGDRDKALAYYHEARALAPDDVDVLRGLADQYFARAQFAEAAREYQALLATGPELRNDAALWYRLGVARRQLADKSGALDGFRHVVELEPDHLPAVEAIAELLVDLRRWPAAARVMRVLLEIAPPILARKVMIELGDLNRDRLGDRRRALELYTAAADARPDDHVALQRRLDSATALGEWDVAIDSIMRFARAESVAMRHGAYLYAAAVISRDELGADSKAVELFEQALDAFFAEPGGPGGDDLARAMQAFVDVDRIHTRRRAWSEQARAYRRMIKRLPAGHQLLGDLWHALGEVYRSRLKRYAEAAAAFEVARSVNPDDLERRAILAELYQLTCDTPTSAAAEHHAVLARDAGRVGSYRALEKIYRRAGRMDQAWCACRALVFLDRAEAAEQSFYRRYLSKSLVQYRAPIGAEMGGRIVHRDESGTIALALSAILAVAASARPSRLRVRLRERIEPGQDQLSRLRLLTHIAAALDRPLPAIYDQTRRSGPLAFGLCLFERGGRDVGSSSGVGGARLEDGLRPVLAPRADFLRADAKSAAFVAARALSLLDPERVLAVLFSEAELRSIVSWMLGRCDNSELGALLDQSVTSRNRPDQHEQLLCAREALATIDWQRDFERWLRAVVITADRTGLLLSGSLNAAARVIAGARAPRAGLTPADRIFELLRYSVTDDYAAIRRRLCARI